MEAEERAGPSRLDYVWTYGSSLLVTICGVLAYKLASRILGEDGFAEYALGRRVLSVLHPIVSSGVGLALARQVARITRGSDRRDSDYLTAGILIVILMSLMFLAPANLFPVALAEVFWGEARMAHLIQPLSVLFLGLSLQTVAYRYLTGKLRMRAASALQVMSLGAIPISMFFLAGSSADRVFIYTGLTTGTLCTLILIALLRQSPPHGQLKVHGLALLTYGLPRIPGSMAQAALLGLPALVSSHVEGKEVAGMVAFGGTLLTLTSQAVTPLAVILLPQSSKVLKRGGEHELVGQVRLLFLAITAVMVPVIVLGLFLLPWFVGWFLSPKLARYTEVLQWMVPASYPFALYQCFRSIVDGAYKRAVNAHNTYIALACMGVAGLLGHFAGAHYPVLVGFVAGAYVLGLLTMVSTRNIFVRRDSDRDD